MLLLPRPVLHGATVVLVKMVFASALIDSLSQMISYPLLGPIGPGLIALSYLITFLFYWSGIILKDPSTTHLSSTGHGWKILILLTGFIIGGLPTQILIILLVLRISA